jgi:hypothetical protein
LLLTTPHRGWLTFLDPGNVKFVLPSLHALIHRRVLRQSEYYERRFGDARRQKGMCADFCTQQAAWHRHYRYEQVRRLAPPELRTLAWACYYPAFRALWCLGLLIRVVTRGRVAGLPATRLKTRLSRCQGLGGDQLIVMFQKVNPAGSSAEERLASDAPMDDQNPAQESVEKGDRHLAGGRSSRRPAGRARSQSPFSADS